MLCLSVPLIFFFFFKLRRSSPVDITLSLVTRRWQGCAVQYCTAQYKIWIFYTLTATPVWRSLPNYVRKKLKTTHLVQCWIFLHALVSSNIKPYGGLSWVAEASWYQSNFHHPDTAIKNITLDIKNGQISPEQLHPMIKSFIRRKIKGFSWHVAPSMMWLWGFNIFGWCSFMFGFPTKLWSCLCSEHRSVFLI